MCKHEEVLLGLFASIVSDRENEGLNRFIEKNQIKVSTGSGSAEEVFIKKVDAALGHILNDSKFDVEEKTDLHEAVQRILGCNGGYGQSYTHADAKKRIVEIADNALKNRTP